jgi:hypothetical protein
MEIYQQLFDLYSRNWDNLINEIKKHDNYDEFQHPYLLSTPKEGEWEWEEEWKKADIKLMIFGIQTNGWIMCVDDIEKNEKKEYYVYSSNDYNKSITGLMDKYEEFYFNGGNWAHGHFWNYFYAIQELLKYHLKDKKVSVIANNVFKIEKAPIDIEENSFNVILDEIKIFKPNVIIQMGYSNDVHNQFLSKVSNNKKYKNMDEYSQWDKDHLLYIIKGEELDDNDFSELKESVKVIISTYHPNSRSRKSNTGIKLKYLIEKTVSELKSI